MSEEQNSEPWTYKRKTADELERLAWDVVGGRVFGTWDVPEGESPQMCFMPLVFMEPKFFEDIKRNQISQAYEYLDKAGPRSVNGLPSFFSCNYLDHHDALELFRRCAEVADLRVKRVSETT